MKSPIEISRIDNSSGCLTTTGTHLSKRFLIGSEPKGKTVDTVTYVDANLCHDMNTGKSVTGVVHMLNKTIIDFFSKKQNIVTTATYGSEFTATRTATEQVIDLRTNLRYMGVPLG